MQYEDDRLNSKQASCRIVHLHKPGLSLSLLMGQKQREKRFNGFCLHCGHRYAYSAIPAETSIPKNPKKQTHPVIQTVFEISSADEENKYFVHH